ncbi:MAG TPA: hypothetical protein VLO11_11745, partial [Luteolibacter sp.]|nr:hypothetical protein [Luteolibacter sp.]
MTSLFGDRPVTEMDSEIGQSGTMADDSLTLSSPLLTEVDVEASGMDIDLSLNGAAGTDISVTATAEATGI